MNARQRNQRGFTLVEMMVSMTAMLIITVAILSVIVAEQRTHLTEGHKLDMNQGGRVIEQMFKEGFCNAGAVLTMANTPAMLGVPTIPFNGIYPLNNDASSPLNPPDGVILSSGDPMALTRLTKDFTPGEETIYVVSVDLPPDPASLTGPEVAWHDRDFGMVMRSDGYYVFCVSGEPNPGDKQLSIRTTAAYYSGLLDTNGYKDYSPKGNVGTYPVDSPVVRLDYFNIFLVRIEADQSQTLTLTTDCGANGEIADVLANTNPDTGTLAVPILPNIEDIQIEYIAKLVPPAILPVIWAGPDTDYPGDLATPEFYNQFLQKNIASARIFILLRTEEEKDKQSGAGTKYQKPAMGDHGAPIMPLPGSYHYTYIEFEVLIRNYNI